MTSTTDHTSHTLPGPTVTAATSMTSCSTVSIYFMQRPNTETETPKHKTLNNTLVPMNEVLSTTWKLSVNHAPHIPNTERHQDTKTILSQGSKLEKQHTRKTLRTLSWVYKPSDYPMVIRTGSPCWSYRLQDLCPTKTVKALRHTFLRQPPKMRFM